MGGIANMAAPLVFTGEEAVDLRRALRDYIDVLRANVIKNVEHSRFQQAKSGTEDLRRYEALYLKVRSATQTNQD